MLLRESNCEKQTDSDFSLAGSTVLATVPLGVRCLEHSLFDLESSRSLMHIQTETGKSALESLSLQDEMPDVNGFDALPNDVLETVLLSRMSATELSQLSVVCKRFAKMGVSVGLFAMCL